MGPNPHYFTPKRSTFQGVTDENAYFHTIQLTLLGIIIDFFAFLW